ncbi:CYTH and CHAD domain-containing protein [Sphingomonas parva]|uniref:CYTH and CHAD domain-containing protein n=1 Tax=Sphingomonas parva TaxID=2555898 RepID=A0A4Y8ZWA5_9SPHN|nr:CYTH and CHAD domain-containing protein [Sphingomonas parva]TFI60194.1 CYTH and CHAD domain-containing protein [Sphingomonas parva]
MNGSEEIELKLELPVDAVDRLRGLSLLGPPDEGPRTQVSTYFDTPAGHVRKAGYSLRVRRKGRSFVQTVKEKGKETGGFSARGEWERRIAGPGLDLEALGETPVARLVARKKVRNALAIASETDVQRTTWLVRRDGTAIELILDVGEVRAGARRDTVCEIELELKSGERGMLFDLAREIGAEIPLRLGVLSKSERGFELTKRRPRIHKAEAPQIAPEASIADAFAAVVQSCLRHFRRNESLVAEARDSEAVHQLRVATRRLRSAFSLFEPVLAGPEQDVLRGDLSRLSDLIGRARDLDVTIAALRRRSAGSVPRGELPRLKRARTDACDELLACLRSDDLPRLFLDVAAWAEAGRWREHPRASRSIEAFAEERLGRLWRKVRSKGQTPGDLSPEERHRLRIRAKKLRYAAEFFGGLSLGGDRRRWKHFLHALEALQESLGRLNDAETLRTISPAASVEVDSPRLLREADESLAALRKIGPYWR